MKTKAIVLAILAAAQTVCAALDPATVITTTTGTELAATTVTLGDTNSSSITSGNQALNFAANGTEWNTFALTFRIDVLREPNTPIFSASGGTSATGRGLRLDGTTLKFSNADDAVGTSSLTVAQGDVLTYICVTDAKDSSKDKLIVINQTASQKLGEDMTVMMTASVDHAAAALTSGTSKIWTGGGKARMTVLGMTDLSGQTSATLYKAGGVLVPEPATATLSLLALAGLAVRRRRK